MKARRISQGSRRISQGYRQVQAATPTVGAGNPVVKVAQAATLAGMVGFMILNAPKVGDALRVVVSMIGGGFQAARGAP